MKKQLFTCLATLIFGLGVQVPGFAADQAVDECSKELLLAYFPEPFIRETLKKFNVPEDKWNKIASELISKDKEVVSVVEEKAAAMTPNPLRDPQARQEAVKLFRDTLLSLFTDVMKANGVDDEKQIQAMLDDLQKQKAERFTKCMQRQAKP